MEPLLYTILYYTREQGVGITLAWSSLNTPSLVGFGIEALGNACPLLSIGHRTAKIATVASNGIYTVEQACLFLSITRHNRHGSVLMYWILNLVMIYGVYVLNQENFLKDIHTVYTSIYSTVHIQQGAVIQYFYQILPYPGVS